MKNTKCIHAALAGILLTAASTGLFAAEQGNGWLNGPWRFSALGYGWLPQAPANIKHNNNDVENLPENTDTIVDGLELAAMLEFEAHKGRLGLFLSPIYYKGKADEHFTGPLGERRKLTVKEKVFLADYGVSWALGPWNLGAEADTATLTLSPFVGARYFHDPIEMKVDPGVIEIDNGLDEEITVEFNTPIIGVKAAVKLSERWDFAVSADFGVANADEVDSTRQYLGGVNYRFKIKHVATRVIAGYRYLHLDLENQPIEVHVDVKGPFIGFGADF